MVKHVELLQHRWSCHYTGTFEELLYKTHSHTSCSDNVHQVSPGAHHVHETNMPLHFLGGRSFVEDRLPVIITNSACFELANVRPYWGFFSV